MPEGATLAFLTLALSRGIRFGSTLTLGIGFRLGLLFQPMHRRFDLGQARLAALQLRRSCIASTTA